MAGNVNITSNGIQKVLKHYTAKQALAEYIWNGFDAGADTVSLQFGYDELDSIESLTISDNGKGIDMDKIKQKFNPFYDSEKAVPFAAPKHTSLMHGKNGVGRLTFFTFAHAATWKTVYKKDLEYTGGTIRISSGGLNTYDTDNLPAVSEATTGTTVSFQHVRISKNEMESVIKPFLLAEFCWFLELHKDKGYRILFNGLVMDHTENIEASEENFAIHYEKSDTFFQVKFVQWKDPLHKELSKYYFLNEKQEEVYKDYTTLNKKCDEFYHSVYIRSEFFNDFDFKSAEDQVQANIFGKARSAPEYKYLTRTINDYLKNKRKPYLRLSATRLMVQYEQEGILPVYKTDEEELIRKPWLYRILVALYEIQPRLFSNFNTEQKKMVIRMIALMLNSNQKEAMLQLFDNIIDLDQKERSGLADLVHRMSANKNIPFESY